MADFNEKISTGNCYVMQILPTHSFL